MLPNAMAGQHRRDQIVAFIRDFYEERGYWPSIREISKGVGLNSPGSAHRQLAKLIEEGRVRREHISTALIVYVPTD